MQNKLIVFEGIDGVGKTTLVNETEKIFNSMNLSVIVYESVEEKNAGFNLIKEFVKNKCSVEASLLFYLASSVEKSNKIKELLKTHNVICDRYVFSTISKHKALGFEIKNILNDIPVIITFLVKIDETLRLERIQMRKVISKSDKIKKESGSIPDLMEKYLSDFPHILLENNNKIDSTILNIQKSLESIGITD